jgi:multiple sugar transport system substrate-binding protein
MGAKGSIILLLTLSVGLGLLRTDRVSPAVSGAAKPVELTFWNGFTGPDGRTMLEMIRDFNQANPDVRVTMQRMDWATYYNKLMVSCVDGRGPEVFICYASTLVRMNRAGFISPADDAYDEVGGPSLKDFDPKVLNQLLFSGKHLGVALDVHPQGMYCNATMLKEAGLVNPDGSARPPKTAEEFVDYARRLRKLSPDGQTEVWGYAFSFWRVNFMAVAAQFGGWFMDDKGNPTVNCAGNVQALTFLTDLIRKDHIVPTPEASLGGWVLFRQSKSAMVFDGVYMVGDLLRLHDLDYIGAPLPQIGPQPGTVGDSHVLCIRTGLTDRQRQAAIRFIRYVSNNSIRWAGAGQVPARLSVRNTDAFRAMQVQYQFSRQVPYLIYPPRTAIQFELQLEIDLAVEKAFRGRATPKEALDTAQANVIGYLERDQRERGVAKDPDPGKPGSGLGGKS